MSKRSKVLVAIPVGAYVIGSAVFLILNDGRHLTHDQLVGWFR